MKKNKHADSLPVEEYEFLMDGEDFSFDSAELKEALAAYPIKVYAGDDAVAQVAAGDNVDVVVNALVGYAGLMPTVAAIKKSKKI